MNAEANSNVKAASNAGWSLNALGRRLSNVLTRHERVCLLIALIVFGARAIYRDVTTPLWFDELCTLFFSRLPTLHQMFAAIPYDGQPPLQYPLTRASMSLFGANELAVRLPELLAYLAAGVLTLKIVRQHRPTAQALFAMGLLLEAYQCQAALDARPYGMLLAFTAAIYAAWQSAAETEKRCLASLCWLALSIAGAIFSHHYGVVNAAVLLGAGETVRLLVRRKLDWPMLASILVGLSALAVTLPLAKQSSHVLGSAIRNSADFWAKPKASDLKDYLLMTSLPLLVILAPLILLLQAERPTAARSDISRKVPVYEWAAVGALCLMIPVQMGIAKLATGYYMGRYAIGTALGMALFFAWGMPRLRSMRRVAEPALALSILAFLILQTGELIAAQAQHPAWAANPGAVDVPPILLDAPGDGPIIVGTAFEYAAVWWYAPEQLRRRLTYLSDVPYAIRQRGFLEELSLAGGQGYLPLKIEPYAAFLETHPRFLLFYYPKDKLQWVEPRLVSEGWRMQLLSPPGDRELIQVERTTEAGGR